MWPESERLPPSPLDRLMNVPRLSSALLIVTLLAGCGSDDPVDVDTPVTVADFVGSWNASSHVFTNAANSSESFDPVAAGGETRTTILTGGGTRTWVEWGTYMDEWDAQISISGNTVTSVPVETTRETRVWTFTLEGSVLTLTRTDSAFDFTSTGAPGVPATEVVTFVRSS